MAVAVEAEKPGATTNSSTEPVLWYIIVGIREHIYIYIYNQNLISPPAGYMVCAVELATCVVGGSGGGSEIAVGGW